MKQIGIILLLVGVLVAAYFLLFAPEKETGPKADTPTTGTIRIMAEESYRPLIDTQIDVFQSIYTGAQISALYGSESEVMQALLTDSVSVAILSRKLTETELQYFKERKFTPKTTEFAKDALALITHPANADSILTVEQVKKILSGEIGKWSDVSAGSKTGDLVLVFDNPNSGVVRYAIDSLINGAKLSTKASALKTSEEVIKYVAAHPNAIGIIGVNWISDMDDPKAQQFLKEIKVVGVKKTPYAEAFTPHQAYLATKDYPFIRSVNVVNAQARAFGLGAGFSSFLAAERGQRIVLKSGMLPATMPIRLVQVKK